MVATMNKMAEAVKALKIQLEIQHSRPIKIIEEVAEKYRVKPSDLSDAFMEAYPRLLADYISMIDTVDALGLRDEKEKLMQGLQLPERINRRCVAFTQPEFMGGKNDLV